MNVYLQNNDKTIQYHLDLNEVNCGPYGLFCGFYFQSLGYEAELYTDNDQDAARYDHRDEIKRFVLIS